MAHTASPSRSAARLWRRPEVLLAGLLAGQLALNLYAATRLSVTVDEFAYIPAGVTYWHQRDHRLSSDHPLLMKYLLAALPSLARPSVPVGPGWEPASQADQWQYGLAFMTANADRYQALVYLARIVPMVMASGLTLVMFLWVRGFWGPWVGLGVAACCAVEPNLLAHGQLATLDGGVTFLAVLALWQWQSAGRHLGRWWSVGHAAAAGLALGWALGTKFTALVLVPVLGLWGLGRVVCPRTDGGSPEGGRLVRLRAAVGLVVLLGTAWGWINLTEGTPAGLLPDRYAAALEQQLDHARRGQGVYIDGRLHRQGVWYYYLYALALKTPLAFQGLAALGVAGWVWGRPTGCRRREELGAGLAAAAILAAGSASSLQMGLRYVLPVIPLGAFVAGRGLAWVGRRPVGAMAAVVLIVAGAVDSLRAYPDLLGYFNVLAGPRESVWRRLADSNLDWGQGLVRLREYVAASRPAPLYLAYWGRALPEVYGIADWELPGSVPRPGTYVVSLNFLAGIPYQVIRGGQVWKIGKRHGQGQWYAVPRGPDGRWDRGRERRLDWLLGRAPDRVLGYGLAVYEIEYK